MFAMTETAAEAITVLTENQGAGEGGLRIAAAEAPAGELELSLEVSTSPESGDEVLGTASGAKVFMDADAARFLEDKVLDVQQDEQGELSFAVYPQDGLNLPRE